MKMNISRNNTTSINIWSFLFLAVVALLRVAVRDDDGVQAFQVEHPQQRGDGAVPPLARCRRGRSSSPPAYSSTVVSLKAASSTTSTTISSNDEETTRTNEADGASTATTIPPPPPPPPPAAAENEKFDCDASVDFWRTFESRGNRGNLDGIRDLLWRNAVDNSNNSNNQLRAAYWSSQLLRTAYFGVTAALGTVGSDLHEHFVVANNDNTNNNTTATASFLNLSGAGKASNLLSSDVPSRLILEALQVYQQDYHWIRAGLLNFPWDSVAAPDVNNSNNNNIRLQWDHKQVNPLFALSETARVVRESIGIFRRRNQYGGRPSRKSAWLNNSNNNSTVYNYYPEYYLNDFHYQTDGWLSSASAQNYEASTETLFLGRQDAMQRQTLIPLLKHFRQPQSQQSNQHEAPPLQILEVAAGTGRFATFLRDNFPQAVVTLTDLSPFYLEKARQNDQYWRDYRGRKLLSTAAAAENAQPEPATLVQANAEALPFPDASFDAVACVYLFHELPRPARENVARELARVLKPGGMLSLTDSVQRGDRPPLDARIGAFARLNEPHYADYTAQALAPVFERHGLECGEKYVASNTKTLSFVKKQ